MIVERAKPEEATWLDEVIKREFPYTDFTPKKIADRINNEQYMVLVARESNILTGFAEVELFPEKEEARLNAVFVEDAWRGQGVATRLIQHAVHECRHKRFHRVFLLVKESNTGAKELYEKVGFWFERIYEKEIQDEKVEVWVVEF